MEDNVKGYLRSHLHRLELDYNYISAQNMIEESPNITIVQPLITIINSNFNLITIA